MRLNNYGANVRPQNHRGLDIFYSGKRKKKSAFKKTKIKGWVE